jgi:hypothetical protein
MASLSGLSLHFLCLSCLYIFFACHITYIKKGQIHKYIFCFYINKTKEQKFIILKYFHGQVGGIFRTLKTTSVLIMLSGDGPVTLTTLIYASRDSQKVTEGIPKGNWMSGLWYHCHIIIGKRVVHYIPACLLYS